MVQFPHSFVQLDRYPGYYWNVEHKKLYSLKSGILKEMKIKPAYRGHIAGGGYVDSPRGYRVSINGRSRIIPLVGLMAIKVPQEVQIVPMAVTTTDACTHKRQMWSLHGTGHCRDCGAPV